MEEIKQNKESKEIKENDNKEITQIFNDEINLGFGISECLQYLENHKTLMDDGIQSDDDEIDIDRYDDLGKKIQPFEQYKMMCHRFHGKKPKTAKEKSSKMTKMKAQELLKIRMGLNDSSLGMMKSTKKIMEEKKQPFIDLFFTSKKHDEK